MENRIVRVAWIVGIVLLVLGLAGCGNKRIDNEAMEEEFENAPEWVLTGHDGETFSAVGSAKIGKSGMQFAKNEALANARNELASQLSVRVNSLVNNFTRATGIGDAQMVDRLGKQVVRQVTRETLNGSRQEDVWISPSSDLYVLVVMDAESVRQSVRNQVASSFRDEEAKWQEYQAKEGDKELDREIDKLF
ncbi:MAG: LPP20 family lipoprotein [Desulfobacterales bacterium]|nr:LPP20 family lipoprotein [Desulfobacterales bacterium]